MKEAADRGEDIPVSVSRKRWREVKGPIGAMALTAVRLGWKVISPFVIQDQWGAEHLLTNASPALIKKMAVDALKVDLERKLANRRAVKEPQFVGRRACIDLWRPRSSSTRR